MLLYEYYYSNMDKKIIINEVEAKDCDKTYVATGPYKRRYPKQYLDQTRYEYGSYTKFGFIKNQETFDQFKKDIIYMLNEDLKRTKERKEYLEKQISRVEEQKC